MDKFTLQQIGKAKVNPVFKGLPSNLKDPKSFRRIEKKLANVMVSDHKHRVISAFNKCSRCRAKFTKKRKMILELGFTSIYQYQNWKRVMLHVINKGELILYEKE